MAEEGTLVQRPLLCSVFLIEISRYKTGHDYVALTSNLPDPLTSRGRGQIFYTWCQRGTGEAWAKAMFPGVELHVYDHTSGFVDTDNAESPARASRLLGDVYDLVSGGQLD